MRVVNRRFREICDLSPELVVPGTTFEEVLGLSVAAGNHGCQTVPDLLAEPENCLLHNESGNYLQSRQMRHLPLPQVRQMMIGPASFMI
ncbi:hypothetical protein [Bradyrhizobium japonicum]|uniref:hypothetical protein n=1 Tax=Bradyrhizobium japonicum TaxID=375 RepID=UPI003398A343